MTIIILLCAMTATIVVWCSVQGSRQSLRCVVISPLLLMDWRMHRPDLIIIELRGLAKAIASEALAIPAPELNRLLRWIPPESTLVFCGRREFDLCRSEIELTLLSAGFNVVYILESGTPGGLWIDTYQIWQCIGSHIGLDEPPDAHGTRGLIERERFFRSAQEGP